MTIDDYLPFPFEDLAVKVESWTMKHGPTPGLLTQQSCLYPPEHGARVRVYAHGYTVPVLADVAGYEVGAMPRDLALEMGACSDCMAMPCACEAKISGLDYSDLRDLVCKTMPPPEVPRFSAATPTTDARPAGPEA